MMRATPDGWYDEPRTGLQIIARVEATKKVLGDEIGLALDCGPVGPSRTPSPSRAPSNPFTLQSRNPRIVPGPNPYPPWVPTAADHGSDSGSISHTASGFTSGSSRARASVSNSGATSMRDEKTPKAVGGIPNP